MLLHGEGLRISSPGPLNLEWPLKKKHWGTSRTWGQAGCPGGCREGLRTGRAGERKEGGQDIAAKEGFVCQRRGVRLGEGDKS